MSDATPSYTPQSAINLVQNIAHGIPLENVKAQVCDMINAMMWHYYPWSWSISSLTPINLLNGVQDYVYTGGFIQIPISLSASVNYGGTYPLAITPNGLSESGTTVTATTNYAHNLPIGTSTAGVVCTISGAAVAGYNGSLTITSVPNNTTIIGTVSTSGLAASGAPGTNDILRNLKNRIVRADIPTNEYRELMLLNNLSPELSRTAGIDTMKAIVFYKSSNTFRFDVAVSVGTNQIIQSQGEYQFAPTRITDANMSAAFQFPDRYFNVFLEGITWQIYRLSDDPRAGTITMQNGARAYSGQLSSFMDALLQMSRTEDLGSGDQFMWPEDSLGVGRSYWPGIYGL